MFGIAGEVAEPVDRAWLAAGLRCLVHRGPDDGVWRDDRSLARVAACLYHLH